MAPWLSVLYSHAAGTRMWHTAVSPDATTKFLDSTFFKKKLHVLFNELLFNYITLKLYIRAGLIVLEKTVKENASGDYRKNTAWLESWKEMWQSSG